MSRRIGPYATIKELEGAVTLVKQLQPGADISYSLQVADGVPSNGKAASRPRSKTFACKEPGCGMKFDSPQALGPHSRAHKRAAEKAGQLPANAEATVS